MRFGLLVSNDDPPEVDPRQRVADHLRRALTARDAGFDTLAVAHRYSYGPARSDHRGPPLRTWRLQPIPLLGYLAGQIGDAMEYVTAVLLSTSAHPVQLAEDAATLDAMCGGRLRLGIGLGWMPYEFEAFGVSPAGRVRRLEELVTLVRRLLTEDEVDFTGRHFQVRSARLVARPVQRPAPPIWLGASAEPAIRRAARLGDAWTISAMASLAELRTQNAVYLAELARCGKPPPAQRPINRWVYVAKTREQAIAQARPLLADWYRKRGDWGWFLAHDRAGTLTDEVLGSGRWIIGSPQDCVEQAAALRDALGINQLIFAMPWPGMAQAQRLRTIELLGERVLPALQAPDPAGVSEEAARCLRPQAQR